LKQKDLIFCFLRAKMMKKTDSLYALLKTKLFENQAYVFFF